MQGESPQAGLELLSTAQASHYDLAASDVSSGPFPAPLPSLDLSGMAEWTLYGRALGDRAIHLLRIRELRILWLCRGRWRGWILQWLPTSAAKAGREVNRCSTVTAVNNRRLIHVALLSTCDRLGLKASRPQLYSNAAGMRFYGIFGNTVNS